MGEPYCIALVLADAIHRDTTTGKFTILGTFSTIGALEFPAKARFGFYYAITDTVGDLNFAFRIVDSRHSFDEESEPLFEITTSMNSPSPLAVLEGHINGVTAELPEPGVYHCELLINDDVVMSRRLVALNPNELGKSDDEDNEDCN